MLRFASAVCVAALLLAACGSSGPSAASQTAASAKQNAGIAFADCVRAHGVPNFPDPASGNGGGVQIAASHRAGSGASLTINGVPVNAPAFQAARRACQKYLPRGRPVTPQQLASLRKAVLAMAVCMRSHGVPNFPDPIVQSGPNGGLGIDIGPGAGGGGRVDPSSPAFQAAQKICGPLVKRRGGP